MKIFKTIIKKKKEVALSFWIFRQKLKREIYYIIFGA